MAYKTVRKNGRDVLVNTLTGKVVQPGERIGNELKWVGKGINDNFTYSDKVDKNSGRRLTPAEVRKAEGKKPPAKPSSKVPNTKASSYLAGADAKEVNRLLGELRAENRAKNQATKPPAPKPQASRPAGTQPSGPAASRPATPAAPKKPAAPASPKDRRVSAATANRESGNYGTSRTNNPMIDDAMKARMRQREEQQSSSSGSSKPEDKSKYVASDGRPYKGPAFGNDPKPSNTASSKNKPAEKGMTLAERMRKRRQGLA